MTAHFTSGLQLCFKEQLFEARAGRKRGGSKSNTLVRGSLKKYGNVVRNGRL